MTILTSPVI